MRAGAVAAVTTQQEEQRHFAMAGSHVSCSDAFVPVSPAVVPLASVPVEVRPLTAVSDAHVPVSIRELQQQSKRSGNGSDVFSKLRFVCFCVYFVAAFP